ncbi:hypothetical protein D3C81_2153560 [compost metagenome]
MLRSVFHQLVKSSKHILAQSKMLAHQGQRDISRRDTTDNQYHYLNDIGKANNTHSAKRNDDSKYGEGNGDGMETVPTSGHTRNGYRT